MSRGRFAVLAAVAGLSLAMSGLSGCAACPGVKSEPAKPTPVVKAAGGPYSIELAPATDVNPVRTQHVLLATVRDANGNAVPGAKVEWILARTPKAVGDIVQVDGVKHDNTYAVSSTARADTTLDWGTPDKADDVKVAAGQSWCVITSAAEGTTNVVAYSPEIKDWNRHKAFAEKNWMDVTWEWPADATNRIGTPHTFNVKVMRWSDQSAYAGYKVNFKILSGPAGTLSTGGQMGTVTTGADGVASVTLNQDAPAVGTNDVEIQIVRPAKKDECECWPEKLIVTGVVRKHWVASDVAIAKTAPATAVVGDQFDYTIAVTNPIADLEVRDVVVTDPLPEGIEYVSSTPAATVAGRTLTWNLGNIPGGGSQNLTVRVKATRRSNEGEFRNCAQVVAEQGRLTRDACATTVVTAPALKVEKYAPAEVLMCDPIPYRIVVRNAGDATTKNVRLVDALPEGITTAAGETRVEFPAFDLAPGESREFTIDARAGKTGSVTNTASANADGGLTDSASATTKIKNCALTLVKKAKRADLVSGRPATFDLTVSNTGDADAKDLIVEDQIPEGMTFVSATEGGTVSGNLIVWNVGTLAPGASKNLSVTLLSNGAGTFRNTATARAYCCKDASSADEVVYKGIPAILLEVVDSPDPIEVGGQTTYTIDVTNQGFADDMEIVIAATLANGQKLVSVDTTSAKGVTHTVAGQKVTFAAVPVLSPKERITYKIVVEATEVGDVRFAVELNSKELQSPVNETESTRQY
jgi:uncharacterized repeat protein (TIGR01451 family)